MNGTQWITSGDSKKTEHSFSEDVLRTKTMGFIAEIIDFIKTRKLFMAQRARTFKLAIYIFLLQWFVHVIFSFIIFVLREIVLS